MGSDVVVGTPGRIQDLMEKRVLKLDAVRFAILDEADQMLDMGFEQDMENILGSCPENRQTLLFSATMPKWVAKVSRRFQKDCLLVDLVGEANTGRLPDTIRLMIMQCEYSNKLQVHHYHNNNNNAHHSTTTGHGMVLSALPVPSSKALFAPLFAHIHYSPQSLFTTFTTFTDHSLTTIHLYSPQAVMDLISVHALFAHDIH